jgi:cation diffusion facilitator family transporter
MLSEGIHSVADTGNQLLLLLGVRRARVPPDELHPFGHGKEIYFWSLIVAIILFGVGGGMSLYEGIIHLQHPTPITNPLWNYAVLAIGVVVEGAAWLIALREVLKVQGEDQSLWQAVRNSKDPAVFTVLGEDSAALVGLVVAFLGVFLAHRLEMPALDDVVRNVLQSEEAVHTVERLLTMHLAPRNVLVATEVRFDPALAVPEVEAAMERVEQRIHEQYPAVGQIFIEG